MDAYNAQEVAALRQELYRCALDAELYGPLIVLRPEMIEVKECARIDGMVKLEGGQGLTIGKHVHVASLAHIGIGGGITYLGDYSAVASGGKVLSGSNEPEGYAMSAAAPRELQVIKRGMTLIGPRAFIGVNAVVMPGVTVNEGAVIGCGAVVTHDVPAWEIWAGVPARKIGYREH